MGSPESVYYDRSLDAVNRLTYRKVFMRPPGINADIQNSAESAREIVDAEFELLGTNAVSADATIATTGGVLLTTHGGGTDSAIILPHLDTSQSAWATTKWDTAKSPSFETTIHIAPSGTVASCTHWAGFKLTNTATVATDDDQVFFRYAAGTASGQWQFLWSVAGTDYSYNVPTSIVAAVAADTRYRLRIEVDSDRKAMGFINDIPVMPVKSNALTSLTTLIPYIGVLEAAATKTVVVKYIECGRAY